MDPQFLDRSRGCALGAAIGDAFGMPLEFGPRQPPDGLVRQMQAGRLPAGTFTDDTEMALALAESLLENRPLDQAGLAEHFAAWYLAGPSDIGVQTSAVLCGVARGKNWYQVVHQMYQANPDSAGNGSVMRCWPVALAEHGDLKTLIDDSLRQSEVTHLHPECKAGSAFINVTIAGLLHGLPPADAVAEALAHVDLPIPLRLAIENAPRRRREELPNSGWVRHTVESAVWGLSTTGCFEDAVVQVANLGYDADTAATVVGALAGAAYGLQAIPDPWQQALRGEWPVGSGVLWGAARMVNLADRLTGAERAG